MIRTLNDKDLDDFLEIRMDSLRLQPEAFGASFSEKPDRRQTRADLKAKNEENFILGYLVYNKRLFGFIKNLALKSMEKKRTL